jgi:hypothetical protein
VTDRVHCRIECIAGSSALPDRLLCDRMAGCDRG